MVGDTKVNRKRRPFRRHVKVDNNDNVEKCSANQDNVNSVGLEIDLCRPFKRKWNTARYASFSLVLCGT